MLTHTPFLSLNWNKASFRVQLTRVKQILLILVFLASLIGSGLATVTAAPAGTAVRFDGTNDYVTFGPATATLGVSTFTLEAWIYRTGAGATASSGSGGITAVPLITKGRGEADGDNRDMNYFFGICGSTLCADFEDMATGGNHPITGVATLANNTWYHVAATYDGTTWRLYLNGNLDKTETENATPRYDSLQHAGLATAMTSIGAASGYFAGIIDEARIWNVARDQAAIQASMNSELASGTGLVGRWGLNDGSGTTASNSIAGSPNGALTNGPTWVDGFPLPDTNPPAAPTSLVAEPFSGAVNLTWTAPADADLAGYNLYRSKSPSVPLTGPINGGTLIPGTSYTDSGRVNGTTYYYVVTAVDTSTNESGASNEVTATPLASLGAAVKFDGVNDYVTFGPNLNASSFTLEAWVKRNSGGATMTTGSNGLDGTSGRPLAYPVLTKGMGQGETPANINMNWFLGITSTGVVGADFEDNAGGVNHPAWGTTTIPVGEWHHIAATYDGTCWALYLDGNLETLNGAVSACPGATPEFTSIQHAGLSAGIGSTGQLSTGFFAGTIDEARVWNTARTPAEIIGAINSELTSASGLIGRWGMNEGSGTSMADSTASNVTGTLTNGPSWSAGAPFDITPPVQYTLTVHVAGNGNVTPAGGTFGEGALVTLTPTADSGWEFDSWSGPDAGDLSDNGDGSWNISMDAHKEITANFTLIVIDALDFGTGECLRHVWQHLHVRLGPIYARNLVQTRGEWVDHQYRYGRRAGHPPGHQRARAG